MSRRIKPSSKSVTPQTAAEILTKEVATLRDEGHTVSIKTVGDRLGVTRQTVYSWLRGTQLPLANRIDELAGALHPKDPQRRVILGDRLKEAVKDVRSLGQAGDPMAKRLGEQPLAVGVVPYWPFAKVVPNETTEDPGFMVNLFRRFAAYAGFAVTETEMQLTTLESQLASGKSDVALAVLATVDRSLALKFFTSPIRISLNAVVFADRSIDTARLNRIRDALRFSREYNSARAREILPVVVAMEVGGIYVKQGLRFGNDNVRFLDTYDKHEYLKALANRPNGQRIPVAVADEHMCMQIIAASERPAVNVFPWCPEPGESEALPRYRLGIAVARQQAPWAEFFVHGMAMLLDADAGSVAALYQMLREDLLGQCSHAIAKSNANLAKYDIDLPGIGTSETMRAGGRGDPAQAWVNRLLGLSDLETPPEWRGVLNLVQKNIATEATSESELATPASTRDASARTASSASPTADRRADA